MSVRRTTRHAAVATAALSATVLLGLGSTATADPRPPATDVDPCSSTLARVAQWPGTLGDGSLRFSDAYELYLLRQPSCTAAR